MVAERGYVLPMGGKPADGRGVGDRRTEGRIITSVELVNSRRPGYATEFEESMAESSANRADKVEAKAAVAIAVVLGRKARKASDGQSSDFLANTNALPRAVAAVERER